MTQYPDHKMSDPERSFVTYWRMLARGRFVDPHYNYKFDTSRGWLLDFAWPEARVAVEIHGGRWQKLSRHLHPVGFADDREKMNTAQLAGWIVLEYCADVMDADPGRVIDEVIGAIEGRMS